MAKQIKGSDIIQDNALDNHIEQLKEVLRLQKEIDSQIKQTARDTKSASSGGTGNSAAAIEKQNQALKESDALKKASLQLDAKILSAENQLALATDKRTAELAELKLEQQRANKAAKENAVLSSKSSSVYEKQSVTLNRLRKELKDLILTEGQGSKATKEMQAKVTALDQSLKKADASAGQFQREVGNYGKAVSKVGSIVKGFGVTLLATFSIGAIKSFFSSSIAAFVTQEKAVAKVTQALKSTQNAVGKTTEELQTMASELQKTTLFGDEDILNNATAQLLTFTNIAGNNFDRTQKVALDLATVLDGDLKSASIQLGKALNDPVANLSALSRSGIQFSASQKEVINTLAKSGKLAEAQGVILSELERQYGGQAEAAAKADGGLTQLSNAFGDFKEKAGKAILEGLKPFIQGLKEFFENVTQDDIEKFIAQIVAIGKGLANVVTVFTAYNVAQKIAIKLGKEMGSQAAKNFGAIGVAIGLAIVVARALYEEFTKLTQAEQSLNTVRDAANEKLAEEKFKLLELGQALNKTTTASKERQVVLDEINATYGTTLQNLDDEAAFLRQIETAYKGIIAQIEKKALAQALENEATELQQKLIKIDLELRKDLSTVERAGLNKLKGEVKDALGTISSQMAQLQFQGKKSIDGRGGISELTDRFSTMEGAVDKAGKSIEKTVKKTKEFMPVFRTEINKLDSDLKNLADNPLFDKDDKGLIDGFVSAGAEATRKAQEEFRKRQEMLKKMRDESLAIFKDITDGLVANIDKRIEARKNEISESATEISRLQALAAGGNTDAAEAIKAERIKQAKDKIEVEKLEKKKKNLLLEVAFLNKANLLFDAGDKNGFSNSLSSLKEAFGKLPKFFDGTDTTVGAALGRTGTRDGHIVRVHDNEHIIGANDSNKLHNAGLLNNSDIVNSALAYQNNAANAKALAQRKIQAFTDANIVGELKSVKQAIENIKIVQQHIDLSTGMETIVDGNKTVRNNHRPTKFKI